MANCSSCQASFLCGFNEPGCWCTNKPTVAIEPGKTCLCPACLDKKIEHCGSVRCFRLWVSYIGQNFCGFQAQVNSRTVQGELLSALKSITGEDLKLTAAGRTDAGVSAQAQTVSLEFKTRLSAQNLLLALASKLPHDMAVWRIDTMPLGFDARRQSVGKQYIYRIQQGLVADPFLRNQALHVRERLDISLMQEAASFLLGDHDFSSFRSQACTASHARRYIWRVGVEQKGSLIEIDVRGNAFCLNMVRIMVGTLIEVGKKRRLPITVKEALTKSDRRLCGVTAKPDGLTLATVYYPDDLSRAGIPDSACFPRYPVTKETWFDQEIVYGEA